MLVRISKLLAPGTRLGRLAMVLALAFGTLAALPPGAALAATFTVTKTADTNDGACDADCSLREAIVAANAAAGADVITLPAGTFTLTRAGVDNTAANGDLDVTGPLTINGAGQGSTIIEAGSGSSTAIDRVFSFNPVGTSTGFAVALSDLTIRNGKNPNAFATQESDGGCFDFDGGTSGLGSLSLTSVTVSSCETTDGDAGGVALFLVNGGSVNISGSTIQNTIASRNAPNSGNGGGLSVFCVNNGKTANLTISNSTIQNNSTRSVGGTNNGQGGGLFFFGACAGTPTFNYQLHHVTITGNSSGSDGAGIYSTAPLTIDNSGGATVISNNTSGRDGGGIWLNHTSSTSNISKVTITGNSAAGSGGGIYLGTSTTGNALNVSFSRIVNNTAANGRGLLVNGGTANADNNWWGCSTGPSASPCDTAGASAGSVDFTPWLRVLTTASPSTIVTNQSSSLTASVNTNSAGTDVSANVDLLKGLAVTWSAVGGNISGAQTTIQSNGTATATYQATAANASNKAAAKVDNDGTTSGSNVASITVNKADTTTTITSDTPDPSVVGQSVTVQYSVSVNAPGAGTPTALAGNVTVSDGTQSCTATVAAGQCSITFASAGARTLTATYAGDGNFTTSTSAGAAHTVNKADTTTTITSDTPDPSNVGQSVTVSYTVAANAPGAGTTTGNVTVSDGVDSCSATVATGQCSITLTTAGSRTLTATYAGDANYNSSSSAGAPHNVISPATTTTITADTPDPSVVGQSVTINYTVTAAGGTPSGNVTVSDGTQSCTGTVAAGQCSIAFASIGARTLTATYLGDGTFTTSTSASVAHQVDQADTTTTITSDTPDPSVVGQSVTVNYTVAASAPGAGTPTGNVTVSDGVDSCTATVATGQCAITLTTAGARTLTATYAGDANFTSSTSADAPHSVISPVTTTTITADTPDPSVVGQSVTINYTVTAVGGTPSGNVTVSDGTQSCTGTVAGGQCSITFASIGARTLTATYLGDGTFTTSTSASVAHTVNKADTTTTITSDNPDPSTVGQAVTVQYSVSVNAPGAGTPTGNVTVSDGTVSCTATVVAGQCNITFTSAGAKSLTATYAGDSTFSGSTSASEAHSVDGIPTTTAITSDAPDPSVVGQAVTVQYSIAAGGGTPTGNVTVSDGTVSCTASVAAGECALTFTSAGAKSLTATYAGDSTFSGSTSAAAPHTVNKADTTTTITSDTPDPSVQGSAVTVHYSVSVNAPGAGTTTGNVTVSDGVDSCTGTVAAGQCSIALTTVGSRTLTATYAGDGNFNGSTSAGAPHTVNPPNTAPTAVDDTATVNEDSSVNVNVLANDSDPDGDTVFVSGITQPAHGTTTNPGSGIVRYVPAANYFGSDSFTYTISDGKGGTATATVNVTVNPVNDAPSFTKGPDVTVAEDSGAKTVSGWATAISTGPANESGQTLTFQVTNNNTSLFSAQPAIAANGTLTFTPASNANGSATVTVMLKDNGGTANGGVDSSAPQTFTITVTPVNDAPTVTIVRGDTCTGDFSGRMLLSVSDVDNIAGSLTLTGSSSSTSVVPNGNITFGGSGANRTVSITAVSGSSVRNATVTIKVSDGSTNSTTTIKVVVGTNKNDSIDGSSGADMIFAGNGGDTIKAGSGNDLVCGGNGDNSLHGGDGNDVIEAGNGNDKLYGEDNNDILRGGNGNDSMYGGDGGDTLTGGLGADFFSGGSGTDSATDFTASQGDTKDSTIP
ncbi:MAG: Ig-like domain repeat protein [Kouleothrix sp.]|nr:Ig-like domain repeat protein [Kouleothrix sp.]